MISLSCGTSYIVLIATKSDQGPLEATKKPITVKTIIFPILAVPWISKNSDNPSGNTPPKNSTKFVKETLNLDATKPINVIIGKIDKKREKATWPGSINIAGFCVIS